MQATDFYNTKATDEKIALVLLTINDCCETTPVQQALRIQQFKGALGEFVYVGETKTVYVGAGDGAADHLAIAQVVNRLPSGIYYSEMPLSHAAMVVWSLAQYRFDRYKTVDIQPRCLNISSTHWPRVCAETTAIFKVRDLINAPPNVMGPKALAEALGSLASAYGGQFQTCVGEDLLQDNYPAIHAVGRAAEEAPRLASMTWGNPAHPRVTLVGKGVCFDSGGLDIKPASGMRFMKKDMGGAAHVIGLAEWIMMIKLPIYLNVLIPAVENAVGSRAYRPGDVLTMRNGLTVEIDNTDAEGRLILADALVKACEEKPDLLIDFATLTGAARVAVGTEIAAFFTNSDEVSTALNASAAAVDDFVWRLPLFRGYAPMIDSLVADLSNSGASPYAGAITAALFLERFVDASVPWIHFDIMAWNVGNKPGKPDGGEAMGMRAVAHYLMHRFG